MHILPVLDLLDGQVVRGVGGRRHEYRPVVSQLTTSPRPLDVASAFREHFGLTRLYLADLDAISGQPAAQETYRVLQENGFELWADAGISTCQDGDGLLQANVAGIIAASETLSGIVELERLVNRIGPERLIFSLDLKNGTPLTNGDDWQTHSPQAIAKKAIAAGIRRMILLDLAKVGMGTGAGTESLCISLLEETPDIDIVTGGGIRNVADLDRLQQCGVWGALVASALHDGRLKREDIESISGEPA